MKLSYSISIILLGDPDFRINIRAAILAYSVRFCGIKSQVATEKLIYFSLLIKSIGTPVGYLMVAVVVLACPRGGIATIRVVNILDITSYRLYIPYKRYWGWE